MNVTNKAHMHYILFDDDEADKHDNDIAERNDDSIQSQSGRVLVCVFCLMMTKFILIIMMIILK